ncbi:MAG: hypothetical protein HZA50_09490 [Planctomycetes bacterium]|nr:hypothetical protein [Planctomycetota bacterium]
MVTRRIKKKLLGVGLDNKDGQVRITKAENFGLIGGSQETHLTMQEKCIRFNEKLADRGKTMDELEKQEFLDLAQECQMNLVDIKQLIKANSTQQDGRQHNS